MSSVFPSPYSVHHHRHQALVVDLLRGAQAQAAFPFGAGQVFVGRQLGRFHLAGVVHQGAGAHRQAEPLVVGVAQVGRHVGLQGFRLDRAQQAFFRRLPQVAGVDRQQHVGRGVPAFGFETRHQRAFLVGDEFHLHPGFAGVGVEQRLDELFVACGIHHHLFGQRGQGRSDEGQGGEQLGRFHVGDPWGPDAMMPIVLEMITVINNKNKKAPPDGFGCAGVGSATRPRTSPRCG